MPVGWVGSPTQPTRIAVLVAAIAGFVGLHVHHGILAGVGEVKVALVLVLVRIVGIVVAEIGPVVAPLAVVFGVVGVVVVAGEDEMLDVVGDVGVRLVLDLDFQAVKWLPAGPP